MNRCSASGDEMQDKYRLKQDLIAELKVLRKRCEELECHQPEIREDDASSVSEEKYFHRIADTLSDALYTTDENGNFTYWNKAAQDMFGYSKMDIIGRNNSILMDQKTLEKNRKAMALYRKTGQGSFFGTPKQSRAVRKDGTVFPVEVCASKWRDNQGHTFFTTILRDITARQREDADRAAQTDFLNNVFDTISDGIVVSDANGTITRVNRAVVAITGYPENEIIGRHPADFVPADFEPQKRLSDFMETGRVDNYVSCWQKKDGSNILIESNITFIKNRDNEITGAVAAVRDVTRREESLLALEASEERFKAIAESMSDGVFTTDFDGNIVFINQAALRMYGYDKTDLLGSSFLKLVPKKKAGEYLEGRADFDRGNRAYDYRHQLESYGLRKNGTRFPVDVSVSSWMIRGDIYFSAVVRDITERRKQDEEIRSARDLLDNIFSTMADGFVLTDPCGKITMVNNAVVDMLGYDRDEIVGRHTTYFTPPGLVASPLIDQLFETGVVNNYVTQWQRKDGGIVPLECNLSLLKDQNGEVLSIISSVRDISKRLEAEQQILSGRDFLENLLTMLPDGLVVSDAEGKIIRVNSVITSMLGYAEDELIGKMGPDFIPDGFAMPPLLDNLFKDGSVKNHLVSWQKKDGTVFPVEMNISLLRDGEGRSTGSVAIIRDVTEKKAAEKRIQDAKAYLEKIYQTLSDGIIITDDTGYIQEVNPTFEKMLGYTSDELVTKHISELYPFDRRDNEYRMRIADWVDGLFINGTASGLEMLWQKKNGSLCYIEANASLLVNEHGDMYGTVSCVRDITRRKEIENEKETLEMRLRQVQKMEAIGTLAGGIAHDFNNILSAVMGYTELSLDDVPEGSRPYQTMQEVLIAARRARDLVDQILAFSRHSEHDNKPMNLVPIIKETVRFLKATLPATIKINMVCEVETDLVYSDPTKIHQVIMNLATNAAYAMREKGGELQVTLHDKFIGKDQINKYDGLSPGTFLIMSVSDTGTGMMPEVMSRIFNPFFTTKPPGEGSGMGLSVVHGIVKSCKGDIRFESKLGAGSVFSVYLPRASDLPDDKGMRQSGGVPSGTETILLVDDEVTVANMLDEMLGRLGYTVTVVHSSVEALDVFMRFPDKFDLVITDYTMPDMTGIHLAEKIKKVRRDMPVILCTGFSDDLSSLSGGGQTGISSLLKKPVTKSGLAIMVRQLLDREYVACAQNPASE